MKKKSIKVFFFGDSICIGQFVAIHQGWVAKISERLSCLGARLNMDIWVANASANGRTTRQALEIMPYEVQNHSPDILIIQFGMNDCNYWASDKGAPRVSPAAFEANLVEIIDRAFLFGTKRIFLNTNHPTGLDAKVLCGTKSYEQSNRQYNEIIRKVFRRRKKGVLLNDMEKVLKKRMLTQGESPSDYVMPKPDLLHLNSKGHQVYFDVIYPKLEKTVISLLTRKKNAKPGTF